MRPGRPDDEPAQRPLIIGVAGGSGSGKTTVVRAMTEGLGTDQVTVIHHDSYYRDSGHLSPAERQAINYDHPDALETELLVQHIHELRQGRPVAVPVYDFAGHRRMPDRQRVVPGKVIIVDGLLILWDVRLRDLMDIRVYVDTDADVRLIRRLERDIRERGRSVDSVIQQYTDTVRPMHLEFVEPSKRYADLIVPEGGHNRVAVEMLVTRVRAILS
ncbi:MAG TPA: uridine kinase [Longimicrobiales bacterium]|nr:uridine kinase [Longimicrobiales bacterium]